MHWLNKLDPARLEEERKVGKYSFWYFEAKILSRHRNIWISSVVSSFIFFLLIDKDAFSLNTRLLMSVAVNSVLMAKFYFLRSYLKHAYKQVN